MLPLSEYYKHSQMADGHLNFCKSCVKKRVTAHRHDNLEAIQEYDRKRGNLPHRVAARKAYAKTLEGKEAHMRAVRKSRKLFPEKYKARGAVANALRSGRLKKQPCEICGDENVHGHHDDYSKPLDVRWLCPVHHREAHKDDV